MGPQGVKHVLVSVGDITSSVLLSRELQESHANANAQLDMMIGMMRTDPLQLISFLDTAEVSLSLVNSILKEPARTDAQFRKKLGGLLRELHSLKGEAAALDLTSIAERVHALEDMVGECGKKRELSGNDFLPVVLKLDELMAHLRGVREMASRLTLIKEPAAEKPADAFSPTLQAPGLPARAGSCQAVHAERGRSRRRAAALREDRQGLPDPDAAQRGRARHRDARGAARTHEAGMRVS